LAALLGMPSTLLAAPPTLLAAPAAGRTTEVFDEGGALVARVVERPGVATRLDLRPGSYRVVAADGAARTVEVPQSGVLVLGEADAATSTAAAVPATTPSPQAAVVTPSAPTSRAPRGWTRWGAPLLATFVPGLGHAVAGRPGAGVGIFAGAGGLLFGSIAFSRARDRREGAAFGARGRSATRESLRQLAFVGATDALALLWIGQIADAWVTATGKRVRGRTDHVVSIGFTRSTAVGIRPGEPAIARYDDWTVQLLGQVSKRVLVGLSDLGLHLGPRGQVTVQGGARVAVRAVETPRFWLVPAFALILQGTSARGMKPLDGTVAPRERGQFAFIPYVQLEGRIFVLDRLSLDVAPRLSVPLGTRFYGKGAAIPRFAPTFELAAGPTVYF
jgi:hypothetical protein